jgi:hypothetical protein
MAKRAREQAVKERRERKQAKREAAREAKANGTIESTTPPDPMSEIVEAPPNEVESEIGPDR